MLPSSALTQLNSTLTQTKAEVSFILRQIQPPSRQSLQNSSEQAGTELGQAQLKLGVDCILIFCRFDFSQFGLIELV